VSGGFGCALPGVASLCETATALGFGADLAAESGCDSGIESGIEYGIESGIKSGLARIAAVSGRGVA
jgi:hypothetical protein